MYTASAPRAMAFTTSALQRIPPAAMMEHLFLMPSPRSLRSNEDMASSMGMPTLSRMALGAAPVPPRRPSMAMMSAPALTIPEAMAAKLCTAAILTDMGFS